MESDNADFSFPLKNSLAVFQITPLSGPLTLVVPPEFEEIAASQDSHVFSSSDSAFSFATEAPDPYVFFLSFSSLGSQSDEQELDHPLDLSYPTLRTLPVPSPAPSPSPSSPFPHSCTSSDNDPVPTLSSPNLSSPASSIKTAKLAVSPQHEKSSEQEEQSDDDVLVDDHSEEEELDATSRVEAEQEPQQERENDEFEVELVSPRKHTHIAGEGSSCHRCKQRIVKSQLIFCKKQLARGKRCSKKFCLHCLRRIFSETPQADRIWVCPCCRGLCNCATCCRLRNRKGSDLEEDTAESISASLSPSPRSRSFRSSLSFSPSLTSPHHSQVKKSSKRKNELISPPNHNKKRKTTSHDPLPSSSLSSFASFPSSSASVSSSSSALNLSSPSPYSSSASFSSFFSSLSNPSSSSAFSLSFSASSSSFDSLISSSSYVFRARKRGLTEA